MGVECVFEIWTPPSPQFKILAMGLSRWVVHDGVYTAIRWSFVIKKICNNFHYPKFGGSALYLSKFVSDGASWAPPSATYNIYVEGVAIKKGPTISWNCSY